MTKIFSLYRAVIEMVSDVIVLAASHQIFDGLQVLFCGSFKLKSLYIALHFCAFSFASLSRSEQCWFLQDRFNGLKLF